MMRERGGFVLGLVAGLLIGLALALGVALYITKAPVPFLNKVPQRTAEQDTAETERNRNWDPNAPLGSKPAARPASGGASAPTPGEGPAAAAPAPTPLPPGIAPAPAPAPTTAASPRDPAAILSGGGTAPAPVAAPVADAYVYFVQAGAFTRGEDAEQQRARLGILGHSSKVTEREQAGRTVYRVRLGPFPARDEADALQARLQEQGIEAQIVRVERP